MPEFQNPMLFLLVLHSLEKKEEVKGAFNCAKEKDRKKDRNKPNTCIEIFIFGCFSGNFEIARKDFSKVFWPTLSKKLKEPLNNTKYPGNIQDCMNR